LRGCKKSKKTPENPGTHDEEKTSPPTEVAVTEKTVGPTSSCLAERTRLFTSWSVEGGGEGPFE